MERKMDGFVIDLPSPFGHPSPIATFPPSRYSPPTRLRSVQSLPPAQRPPWTPKSTVPIKIMPWPKIHSEKISFKSPTYLMR